MLDFVEKLPPRVPVYRILDDGSAELVLMSWPQYRQEQRLHKNRWSPRRPEGVLIRGEAR
jgi:hypothetical protein